MENTRNVTLIFLILTFFSSSAISGVVNISSVLDNVQGNISRDIRIVGGNSAAATQFPHAAALFLFLTTGESFCGGSIIHANYIITAAHCLDDLIRIDVQAGILTIFQGQPQYRATIFQRDVRQHPQYDKETLRNDIGLIYAMQPIRFSSGLQPIALPGRHLASSSFIGHVPFVIGT
jgi:secreted trypsin-like serine protease